MKKTFARSLKSKWQGLKKGAPGERFQAAYAHARRRRQTTPLWQRAVQFGLAMVALALGVIFAVIPGPAVVFFALAGALLATESRAVAIALDWIELRLRALGRWAKRHWKRLGLFGRIVVVMLGTIVALAAAAFMAWMLFLR